MTHHSRDAVVRGNLGAAVAARKRGRQKALADALAGVAASLVSLWAFYPVEALKINAQAACAPLFSKEDADDDNNNNNRIRDRKRSSRTTIRAITRLIDRLYAGIRIKSVSTASSSFCYFYLYSWIMSLYHHHHHRRRHQSSRSIHAVPASTRLVLSALAAVLNTLATLPLDVLSTQQQTSSYSRRQRNKLRGRSAASLLTEREEASCSSSNSSDEEGIPCCASDEFSDEEDKKIARDCSSRRRKENEVATSMRNLYRKPSELIEQGWKYPWRTLWKGLVPSLLLCSNPAITFTIFDVIKGRVLQQRTHANGKARPLNMTEAFLIGLLAKFVSTVVTYPLIRAKVTLMVSLDSDDEESSSNSSLWACLSREFQRGGVSGLYKGCNLQLLHTLLKSALLMTLRERVEGTTRQWLLAAGAENSKNTGKTATNTMSSNSSR